VVHGQAVMNLVRLDRGASCAGETWVR